jgi:DNA invertase Pin-like site-specific DNA recombinase
LIGERGWSEVGLFVDEGRSAFTGADRPAYKSLMAAVDAERVEVVVAWHLDRLHRRPDDLEAFLARLAVLGVSVATVVSGDVLANTPAGRLHARVGVAVARHELELKGERQQRAYLQAAQMGSGPHSRRPYGYRKVADGAMEVVPVEAVVVRLMVEQLMAGESVMSIVRDLDRRGIRGAQGGRWWAGQIRECVTHPRLAGWATHEGERVVPGRWMALVSEEEHAALVALFASKETVRRPTGCLLPASLARCGRCGAGLERGRQRGKDRYCCPAPVKGGCSGVSMLAERLDGHVECELFERLDDPEAPWPVEPDESDPWVHLGELTARESELNAIARRREVTAMEFRAARSSLRSKRQEVTRRLDDARLLAWGTLRKTWPGLPLEERRALVAQLVERVELRRASAEERVKVSWRR